MKGTKTDKIKRYYFNNNAYIDWKHQVNSLRLYTGGLDKTIEVDESKFDKYDRGYSVDRQQVFGSVERNSY